MIAQPARLGMMLVATLSLILAVVSAGLGVAFAFNHYAVEQFLAGDENAGCRRDARLAQTLASRLAPFEAGFHFQQAFFVDSQLCRHRGSTCDAQIKELRAAIARRPYWPFAWQRYAETCVAIGDMSCGIAALRHAWRFGANERKVREAALRIGLQHWSLLPHGDQAFVAEVIKYVQRFDKKLVEMIANETGTIDLLQTMKSAALKTDEAGWQIQTAAGG